jgi:O-antigen ligase
LVARRIPIPLWLAVLVGTAAIAAIAGAGLARVDDADNQVKLVIVAIGLVAVIAGALSPVFALGFMLAAAPFEFPVTVAGTYTGTNELLLISFAGVLLPRVRFADVPGWARLGAGAMVLGGLMTLVVAADRTTALWGVTRWTAVLVAVLAAFSLLRGRRDALRKAIDLFLAVAVVEALFGIAQKAGVTVLVGPPFDGVHIDGFFGYYTAFGGFVGVAAVLATGQALDCLGKRMPARAALYGAALLLLLLAAATSLSRGAVLVIGAGWLALLALNARRGAVLVRGLVLLVVFLGAATYATPASTRTQLTDRFVTRVGTQFSDKQRFVLQRTGREALAASPLGLGFRNFPQYLQDHTRSIYINQQFFHCHEMFVQLGLDLGWLGLAGFLLLALAPFAAFLRLPARSPNATSAAGVLAALAGYLAQGLFDYNLFEMSYLVFFGFLLWAAVTALRMPEDDAGRARLA